MQQLINTTFLSSAQSLSTLEPHEQIFVNRSLRLDRIDWVGFDLDYTLALYKTPQYDKITYELMIETLITKGYPQTISKLNFDPSFIVRGIVVDSVLGNLLKLNKFSEICECLHGGERVPKVDVAKHYESLRISTDELGSERFHMCNTSYDLPIATLYSDLIYHFKDTLVDINYHYLWSDLRNAAEEIHRGTLKSKTLENIKDYVSDSLKLSQVLDRLNKSGKKLFLLTNGPWFYANGVMSWMLDKKNTDYPNWWDYFSVVVVEAQKPNFFLQATNGLPNEFREIEKSTGIQKLGRITHLNKGTIYCNGNLEVFQNLCQIKAGNRVLYVGDHIFSDVMISKKKHGWRTLLIIPELEYELSKMKNTADHFRKVVNLDSRLYDVFYNIDPDAQEIPDVKELKNSLKDLHRNLDKIYNQNFGSMLRCKLQQSFFAMQVSRYADMYTANVFNLLNYSVVNLFLPRFLPLPHET